MPPSVTLSLTRSPPKKSSIISFSSAFRSASGPLLSQSQAHKASQFTTVLPKNLHLLHQLITASWNLAVQLGFLFSVGTCPLSSKEPPYLHLLHIKPSSAEHATPRRFLANLSSVSIPSARRRPSEVVPLAALWHLEERWVNYWRGWE